MDLVPFHTNQENLPFHWIIQIHNKFIINGNSNDLVADFGVQCLINETIHTEFPTDEIVAEEDSKELVSNSDLANTVVNLVNSFRGMYFIVLLPLFQSKVE